VLQNCSSQLSYCHFWHYVYHRLEYVVNDVQIKLKDLITIYIHSNLRLVPSPFDVSSWKLVMYLVMVSCFILLNMESVWKSDY
jgi:hypothetical protein